MLTLTVIQRDGVAPASPLSARFDASGGTIGRAATNQLVLDGEPSVSRVHAHIVWHDGHFWLVDRGSNPAVVNGKELKPNQEVGLRDGDEVKIGGFLMLVRLDPRAAERVRAEPFDSMGDPFGNAQTDAMAANTWPGSDDSLAQLESLDPSGSSGPSASAAAKRAARPADAPRDDLDLGIDDPLWSQSIDTLFDLDAGPADADDSSPVRPASSFDTARGTSGRAHIDDPFEGLTSDMPGAYGAPAKPVSSPPAPFRDDAPVLSTAFPPPRMRATGDAFPGTHRQPDPPPPEVREVHEAHETNEAPAPQPSHASAPPTSGESGVALLQAFLEGLDAPDVRLDALTPELMYLLGVLLRESTQGTLDLLVARAATRREMRTDTTMIVPKDNNPLKFSPNVDTALNHLLHPPMRGFMPGALALADAYDDLRAHQVGIVAGMRAALDGVFARFDPAQMEARVAPRPVLDALAPGLSRRARCWDQFVEHYGKLSHEAVDDFHSLFGKAFVKAYEAQIDELRKKRTS